MPWHRKITEQRRRKKKRRCVLITTCDCFPILYLLIIGYPWGFNDFMLLFFAAIPRKSVLPSWTTAILSTACFFLMLGINAQVWCTSRRQTWSGISIPMLYGELDVVSLEIRNRIHWCQDMNIFIGSSSKSWKLTWSYLSNLDFRIMPVNMVFTHIILISLRTHGFPLLVATSLLLNMNDSQVEQQTFSILCMILWGVTCQKMDSVSLIWAPL